MLPPLAQPLVGVDRILVSAAALAAGRPLLCPVCLVLKSLGKGTQKVNPRCAGRFVDTHSFDIFKTPDIPVIVKRTALL
jgi:hypothetical protein